MLVFVFEEEITLGYMMNIMDQGVSCVVIGHYI